MLLLPLLLPDARAGASLWPVPMARSTLLPLPMLLVVLRLGLWAMALGEPVLLLLSVVAAFLPVA